MNVKEVSTGSITDYVAPSKSSYGCIDSTGKINTKVLDGANYDATLNNAVCASSGLCKS